MHEAWFGVMLPVPVDTLEIALIDILTTFCHMSPKPRAVQLRLLSSSTGIDCIINPYCSPWDTREISLLPIRATRQHPELKLSGDTVSEFARRDANLKGFDEALLIDADTKVREGAWSNFFWLDSSGTLNTPASNLLPGIVRSSIIQQFQVQPQDISLERLMESISAAFITQSTSGVTTVQTLGTQQLASDASATIVEISNWYNTSLYERVEPI